MPERLEILVLGPPEVRWKDSSYIIQRRTPRALLFYLAVRGEMVGRSEIRSLFWEDLPENIARLRLRETLNKLRSSLPEPEVLLTTSDLVGLDFERVCVDWLEFQQLVNESDPLAWQIPAGQVLPVYLSSKLVEAIRLWRGAHFLAGYDFSATAAWDDWLREIVQNAEHLRGRVCERLADHFTVNGEPEIALRMAQMALHNDEFNDGLHLRVLSLLRDLDRRSEALDYYTHIEYLYQAELGIHPSPQMTALYQQLRGESPTQVLSAPPDWHIHPSVQVPFVGRQSILEQLRLAAQRGGCIFILGESGIGKTRLVQELATQFGPNYRVITTTCRPTESNLPFQPLVDLLRKYATSEEWFLLSATWASQFLLLIPELADLRPDLDFPVETSPERSRSRLFEALRQAATIGTQAGRLVVFLDDAQWADEATLAAFSYLVERPPFSHHALLILSARSEEISPQLDKMLLALSGPPQTKVVHLGKLLAEDISELVRNLARGAPSQPFVEQLTRDTGGNPLFVLETLRALLERDPHPDLSRAASLPMTDSLYTLIQKRLQLLPPLAHAVLETAAIIGVEFTPTLLSQSLERSLQEISQTLDELEKHILVEPSQHSGNGATYHFKHDKIRETLLKEISPVKAQWLHSQVGRALEKSLGGQASTQAAVLAQHYEAANELDTAFHWWTQAGDRARQLYAIPDALRSYERAGDLMTRAYYLSDEQIYALVTEWSATAYVVQDIAALQTINSGLMKLGQERNSPLLIGAALIGFSDACLATNQFTDGFEQTRQAIVYMERSKSLAGQVIAYNRHGVFLFMLGRSAESVQTFQHALELCGNTQDMHLLAERSNAHYQVAIATILGGWPEVGLQHALQSLEDATISNATHQQITSYSALALARYLLGQYRQGQKDLQKGIELAERMNAWRMLGYLNDYRAMTELALGNFDAAQTYAERGAQLGNQYGHKEITGQGYRVLGDIFQWLRDPHKAAELYQQALQASGQEFMAVDPQFRLGMSLYLLGKKEAGENLLQQTIKSCTQAGMTTVLHLAQLAQARIFFLKGDLAQARKLASHVRDEANQRKIRPYYLFSLNFLGEINLRSGELEAAYNHFLEAANLAVELSYPMMELDARMMLQKVSLLVGRPNFNHVSRITDLLDYLGNQAHNKSHKQAYKDFHKKIIQQTAIGEVSVLALPAAS